MFNLTALEIPALWHPFKPARSHPASEHRKARGLSLQRGLSLVEAAVTTAVAAVITAQLVPGLSHAVQRRHLEGVATALRTDIHFARSQAVALNRPVRMSFDSSVGAGCYVIHSGNDAACTCSANGTPQCAAGTEVHRSVWLPAQSAASVSSNVKSMLFDSAKGTVSPAGTVKVQSKDLGAVHQVVNILGRVRTCSPKPALSGYTTCS